MKKILSYLAIAATIITIFTFATGKGDIWDIFDKKEPIGITGSKDPSSTSEDKATNNISSESNDMEESKAASNEVDKLSIDITSGNAVSYAKNWDKVMPFLVGGEEITNNQAYGFKIPVKKLGVTKDSGFLLPYCSIKNQGFKHEKLTFSYAIDDLGKDLNLSGTSPTIYVIGHSELRGSEEIETKEIERNGQAQQIEADISKYTDIRIVVLPSHYRYEGASGSKVSDDYTSVYINGMFANMRTNKDYIVIWNILLN